MRKLDELAEPHKRSEGSNHKFKAYICLSLSKHYAFLLVSIVLDFEFIFLIGFFRLVECELPLTIFQLRVFLPSYFPRGQHFFFFIVFHLWEHIEIELIVLFLKLCLKLVGLIYPASFQKSLHFLVVSHKPAKFLKLPILFDFFPLRGRELLFILNIDAEFIPACIGGKLVAAWLEFTFGLVDIAVGELRLFDLVDFVPGGCAAHIRKFCLYNIEDRQ